MLQNSKEKILLTASCACTQKVIRQKSSNTSVLLHQPRTRGFPKTTKKLINQGLQIHISFWSSKKKDGQNKRDPSQTGRQNEGSNSEKTCVDCDDGTGKKKNT